MAHIRTTCIINSASVIKSRHWPTVQISD